MNVRRVKYTQNSKYMVVPGRESGCGLVARGATHHLPNSDPFPRLPQGDDHTGDPPSLPLLSLFVSIPLSTTPPNSFSIPASLSF